MSDEKVTCSGSPTPGASCELGPHLARSESSKVKAAQWHEFRFYFMPKTLALRELILPFHLILLDTLHSRLQMFVLKWATFPEA